ncbi:MAG: hypothetical protein LBN74_00670 [Prevotella sp.]|nr:hypothetical protein [Prevotella sp.]
MLFICAGFINAQESKDYEVYTGHGNLTDELVYTIKSHQDYYEVYTGHGNLTDELVYTIR